MAITTLFNRQVVSEAQRWLSMNCIEESANSGKCIKALRKEFGSRESATEAWCALFVSVVLSNAIKSAGVRFRFIKTQSAYGLFNELLSAGAVELRTIDNSTIGSVFVRSRGANGGHIGIVCGIDSEYIYTIEGNTRGTANTSGIDRVAVNRYTHSQVKGWRFCIITDSATQLQLTTTLTPESANFTPSLARIAAINAGSYTREYAMPIVGVVLIGISTVFYSINTRGK